MHHDIGLDFGMMKIYFVANLKVPSTYSTNRIMCALLFLVRV
jgi:hypothetical protein